MRAKRATSRNYASNTEFSDDTSAGEMEREQRRVRSNRLSQQRYREKGNEARNLLPKLQSQIIQLQRENDFLKSLLWQQRDPNSYAMAQQQQKEWNMMNGNAQNADATIAFPQRVMSEISIPSLFNGQTVQQMGIMPNSELAPAEANVNGAEFYVNNLAANNNVMVGVGGGQQQQQTQHPNLMANNGGVGIARTRPIKRPSVRRSVSALNIPANVMTSANGNNGSGGANNDTMNNNNNCATHFAASPQNQYLSAGTTNYGPSRSPTHPNGQAQDGSGQCQWLGSPNGPSAPQTPQSPMPNQQTGIRCRSASITVTPTVESQQMVFNTSLGSNFGQSMSRQISPADSPFELTNGLEVAYYNEQQQALSCPSAPKRSTSFSDMCASYQQMNIQESMHSQPHANEIQQYQQQQQFPVQYQQQQLQRQQVDGFFAPSFAYGIELDPNGPQPKVSSANQAAHFASFQGIELTPINEDTPRLYLEH